MPPENLPPVKLMPYSAPPASAPQSLKNWQRNVICGSFPSTIPVWKTACNHKGIQQICHSCKHLQWTGRRRDNHWSQSRTACLRCPFRKTVEKLTEILFSHAPDLAYATSLDASFDERDASSGVTIPFHPGAAAYYAGQGISVNTNNI